MGQFALYYWRAVFTGMASLPISSACWKRRRCGRNPCAETTLTKFASLLTLTPELKESKGGLGMVRAYYACGQKCRDDACQLLSDDGRLG